MKIDMEKLAKHASITLTCEPSDIPIEGNASAIDAETDRKQERWIKRQLARGNEWAWCTAIVRASYAGLTGSDVLGCCSYLSESDFKQPGDYYDDMVREALRDLAEQLECVGVALAEVCS